MSRDVTCTACAPGTGVRMVQLDPGTCAGMATPCSAPLRRTVTVPDGHPGTVGSSTQWGGLDLESSFSQDHFLICKMGAVHPACQPRGAALKTGEHGEAAAGPPRPLPLSLGGWPGHQVALQLCHLHPESRPSPSMKAQGQLGEGKRIVI